MEPLKVFFNEYGDRLGFKWDEDEKKRTLDIGRVYDFNNIALEEKPRILVSRGTYRIAKTSLTDNMAKSVNKDWQVGLDSRENLVFIDGTANVRVEARNVGTCEILTDMVSHFIVWTRPLICDYQGFKQFGLDSTVTEPRPDIENKEKFIVDISVPYYLEERWKVDQTGIVIKNIIAKILAQA